MPAADAIQLIHEAGGLAVMAHPGLNKIDDSIPALVEAGLDGLECFHTKHTEAMRRRYLKLAKQLKLLVTGGSDCHGMTKGEPTMGKVKINEELVDILRERVIQRAAPNSMLLAEVRPKSPPAGAA